MYAPIGTDARHRHLGTMCLVQMPPPEAPLAASGPGLHQTHSLGACTPPKFNRHSQRISTRLRLSAAELNVPSFLFVVNLASVMTFSACVVGVRPPWEGWRGGPPWPVFTLTPCMQSSALPLPLTLYTCLLSIAYLYTPHFPRVRVFRLFFPKVCCVLCVTLALSRSTNITSNHTRHFRQ